MAKKNAVKDKEMEFQEEYDMDFEFFNSKYDELCLKHRNEFVARKNRQVYSNRDPLKLLEILNDNNIDSRHAVIEFMKDR